MKLPHLWIIKLLLKLKIQDLTALVVTHKLNELILKKYDRILFMKDGGIVEDGSFDELMDRKGEFYKMFKFSE